jgi:hypothetical protein
VKRHAAHQPEFGTERLESGPGRPVTHDVEADARQPARGEFHRAQHGRLVLDGIQPPDGNQPPRRRRPPDIGGESIQVDPVVDDHQLRRRHPLEIARHAGRIVGYSHEGVRPVRRDPDQRRERRSGHVVASVLRVDDHRHARELRRPRAVQVGLRVVRVHDVGLQRP